MRHSKMSRFNVSVLRLRRRAAAAAAALLFAPAAFAVYAPAGTVAFADLQKLSAAVASLAASPKDVVLTKTVPHAVRAQAAAVLFGPMRPGSFGVAVCYVDAAAAAKIGASHRRNDDALDRAKRWSVLYPAAMTAAEFVRRHPEAKFLPNTKTYQIPPGRHSRRTLWAHFTPDGRWVALGPSAAIANHTPAAARDAAAKPLGDALARVEMSAAGARVVFGADTAMCAGGSFTVRLVPAGLEIAGAVATGIARKPLPPAAAAFPGVPADAVEFGASTSADDIRSADVFLFAGPEMAAYVKKSLSRVKCPGYSAYYLKGRTANAVPPGQRFARLMPEAARVPASNVMFCSLTHVLKQYLPAASATMPPVDAVRMQVGMRLLRPARGDGSAFATWREGRYERFILRISRDDLRGTANLWALLLD